MNNRDLIEAIQKWADATYGLPAETVTIRLRGLADAVVLPVFKPAAPREDAAGESGLSPVVLDILKILREVNKPLSRTRILEEMAKRGLSYSERTVAGYLARLVEDGTLENPGAGRGGYRFPRDEEESPA